MKKKELSSIESFLREKITDKNAVFVFPTDIVCQSWAEWCIIDGHTSVKSVALERFLAWDHFKGKFLSAEKEDSTAIPSLLRKMFVYDIIRQNAESPFFKKIIRPQFAFTAYSFADWLEKNLPSLKMWKKKLDQNKSEYGELDEEDKDYELLYQKYNEFLEKNSLFEPSWIEHINFSDEKRDFYIFYPEQLADFSDFDEIFSEVPNITALVVPKQEKRPKLYFYQDARRELRQTILRIINLVKTKKADWTEIALSIPDIETYRPYIQREFEQYGVPFVFRSGTSLTKNSAGRIFQEIYDCHETNFSYDSIRTLVLDECIPWNETISLNVKNTKDEPDDIQTFNLKELREALVREGNRMRCICSYEEKNGINFDSIDIWEEAFSNTYTQNKVLQRFYRKLKLSVNRFFSEENQSFANLISAWSSFKNEFINDGEFSSDANKILGRCITHLQELSEIQEAYKDSGIKISNPFQFYLNVLNKKMYTKQSDGEGVSVVPYKLTAGAWFKYQFVLDSSQKKLEVPYKPLSFLNAEKRKKLKLFEDEKLYNATEAIIRLYAKPVEGVPEDFVHFSASENSFSGFAIPHSLLDIEESVPDFDKDDFILSEKAWIESGAENSLEVSALQKNELDSWVKTAIPAEKDYQLGKKLSEKIKYSLVDSKNASLESKNISFSDNAKKQNKISARGDLEKFFPCPRKWILSQILHLNTDSLDTDLMTIFDMGNLHHKILELFCKNYLGKNLPYYDKSSGQFFKLEENSSVLNGITEITQEINELLYGNGTEENEGIVVKAIKHISNDFHDSPLVIKTLLNQKQKIAQTIVSFLKELLLPCKLEDSEKSSRVKSGIGTCIVFAVEGTFISEQEDFSYYGKIDCVVKTPDTKQYILLDYKNSYSAIPAEKDFKVDEETGILKDYQMAVYCRLLSNDCEKEIAAAYFYSIKPQSTSYKKLVFDKSEKKNYPNFEPTVIASAEYAKLFNDKTSDADPDFQPETSGDIKNRLNTKVYSDCIKCNFKAICRTTYSVAGKQIKTKKD